MYATWKSYGTITEQGSEKSRLRWVVPEWTATSGGYNRADIIWLSTPYDKTFGTKLYTDTRLQGDYSGFSFGARPALYH